MEDSLHKLKSILHDMEVVDPFALAELLVKEKIISIDKKSEAAAIVLTTPTSLFLYDGVRLYIQKILHGGSDIILWTQGDPQLQRAKCDTSGLLQLAENTQGHIEVAAATDKIVLLDSLLTKEKLADKKRLVFIDDKSSQILRTYQDILKEDEVEHRPIPKDIMYIWLRKDAKTRNIFPPGFPSLEELNAFIQEGTVSTSATIDDLPVFANTLYLVDFDRTLFDTDKWFTTVQERIASEVCAS